MEARNFFSDHGPNHYNLQSIETYFTDKATQTLILAALGGDTKTAKSLVVSGANPNAQGFVKPGSSFEFSPLHYLMAADSVTGIRVLAAVGGDPEHKSRNMGTPLLFAVTLNNPELLSLLLDIKPVKNLASQTQQQLLFEAARRDAPRCLTLMLDRGVPLDIPDSAGYTLFLRSFEMGKPDLALWLLQRGAAIDFAAANGATPVDVVRNKLSVVPQGGPQHRMLLEIQHLMRSRGALFE